MSTPTQGESHVKKTERGAGVTGNYSAEKIRTVTFEGKGGMIPAGGEKADFGVH